MRDSDRDLTTKILVGTNSKLASLADLKGKTVAVGASDSPQATLIPLGMIADAGLDPGRDFRVSYNDVMVGKHGDHVGGEREAAKALAAGLADAACVLDANYPVFINEGTLDPGTTRVLATTPPFDHCNFTVRADRADKRVQAFVDTLLAMSFPGSEGARADGTRRAEAVAARAHQRLRATRESGAPLQFLWLRRFHSG